MKYRAYPKYKPSGGGMAGRGARSLGSQATKADLCYSQWFNTKERGTGLLGWRHRLGNPS
jgi:hypothetical protein